MIPYTTRFIRPFRLQEQDGSYLLLSTYARDLLSLLVLAPNALPLQILWALYFTSEDSSLMLHLFNSMGTGGLTPPGRHSRRATMNRQSTSGLPNNGYAGGISSGGYGGGAGGGYGGPPIVNTTRSMSGAVSNKDAPTVSGVPGSAVGASAPLISGGGVGDTSAGSHQTGPTGGDQDDGEGYAYKAKALYACGFHSVYCKIFPHRRT